MEVGIPLRHPRIALIFNLILFNTIEYAKESVGDF